MPDTPPLDQRSRRRLARTGIPQSIVLRGRASQPATALLSASAAKEPQPTKPAARMTETLDSMSDDSDDGDYAPRTITTSVSVHTHGGDMVKRPRPSTSSSGGSDEQEDKRVKLTRLALTTTSTMYHADSLRSASLPIVSMPLPSNPKAPSRREEPTPIAAARTTVKTIPAVPTCSLDTSSRSSETPHEQASWPKDSTSYAGLASLIQYDVPMRPASPQPGTSYAAAAATPASPRCSRQPAPAPQANAPVPRSAYPPLVVERLPNWTKHFEALSNILGHAPNARPLGGGVRFLPKSTEEFRAVQQYLTAAAAQDSAISWYCYSPATEIPAKVAIRGLPQDTPTEAVVAALCALGFPAEAARAIPPPRNKHGCTYFVRLAYMTQEELRDLYATTELLYMPQVTVEAWRGGQKPPQCFRCQLYSHASSNCHRPVRCVRCAGEHAVRDCTRPRDDPTCANCGQGHAANDRRCTHYKREARRRGIAQLPPPPRAKQRQRQRQRASEAPADEADPPASQLWRNARPNAGTAPDTTIPSTGAPALSAQAIAAPAVAPRTVAATRPLTAAAAPAMEAAPTTSSTRPATLVADANPPNARGKTTRRRRNRAPRPARTAPAAASTPQQRQPRDGAPTSRVIAPPAVSTPATVPATAPATQAPPSTPSAQQPVQGEAQTNPDFMAMVRVVVEALTTGLTAYLQGQGALQALAAGMAVLIRLHSC